MAQIDVDTELNDQVSTTENTVSTPIVNDIAPPSVTEQPADEYAPVDETGGSEVQTPLQSATTPVLATTDTSRKFSPHLIVEAVLVLALLGVSGYALQLNSSRKDLKAQVATLNANPTIVAQRQTDQLIAKVGSLMQLPSGEVPTVANVSDAAKAKQQSAFFANAQNGDRVLMYVKAGEAILYRPSTNKIVLVAPLTFTGDNSAAAAKN